MHYAEQQAALADRLRTHRLVPVLVLERVEDGLRIGRLLLEYGLAVAEITLRTPAGIEVIAALAREFPGLHVGAGTVLNVDDLHRAFDRGARFAVAPGLNPAVMQAAVDGGLPFSPGVATPTEIEAALAFGCRTMKFFPAEAAGGLPMLKAMAAPYKHLGVSFMPTGGVTLANAPAYWAEPAVAAVGGTWLGKPDALRAGHWDLIEAAIRDAAAVLKGLPR